MGIPGVGEILNTLEKPRGALTGAMNWVSGSESEMKQFMRDYEYSVKKGIIPTDEDNERYRLAVTAVGGDANPESWMGGFTSAVGRGFDKGVAPSEVLGFHTSTGPGGRNIGEKTLGTVLDVGMDPLNAIGGGGIAAKAGGFIPEATKVAPKLDEFLKGMGAIGGSRKQVGNIGKLGQFTRRGIQGVAATQGDPLMALGVATGIGGAERTISKLAPAIGRAMRNKPQTETKPQLALPPGQLADETLSGVSKHKDVPIAIPELPPANMPLKQPGEFARELPNAQNYDRIDRALMTDPEYAKRLEQRIEQSVRENDWAEVMRARAELADLQGIPYTESGFPQANPQTAAPASNPEAARNFINFDPRFDAQGNAIVQEAVGANPIPVGKIQRPELSVDEAVGPYNKRLGINTKPREQSIAELDQILNPMAEPTPIANPQLHPGIAELIQQPAGPRRHPDMISYDLQDMLAEQKAATDPLQQLKKISRTSKSSEPVSASPAMPGTDPLPASLEALRGHLTPAHAPSAYPAGTDPKAILEEFFNKGRGNKGRFLPKDVKALRTEIESLPSDAIMRLLQELENGT